jgi:NAD(P)-dependent dehydrogenase (short-subunit alcohol dehydrogenase family)
MSASPHTIDLTGRVVIVTGGAGMLGREYVAGIVAAGGRAIVADIDRAAARRVAARSDRSIALPVDVSDSSSVSRMVRKVLKLCGRIDGLVNNAALDPKFDPQAAGKHSVPFENYPVELWNRSLAVDLTGMFLCAQAVAPAMLAQGSGAIVNVSSTYGLAGPDQRLYQRDDPAAEQAFKPVSYAVTKSAAIGLTRYLAAYWGGKGIRVNTLSPGGVFNGHDDEFVRRYAARTPLGRMAARDEYTSALLFLLSDASSYMTGSNLIVDGGWTAW